MIAANSCDEEIVLLLLLSRSVLGVVMDRPQRPIWLEGADMAKKAKKRSKAKAGRQKKGKRSGSMNMKRKRSGGTN